MRWRDTLLALGWMVCQLGCTSCREEEADRATPRKEDAPQATSTLSRIAAPFAKATREFGLDLYQELASTSPGNVAISPASISIAFAMASAGARGGTREQMTRVLHLSGTRDDVAASAAGLLSSLNALNAGGTTLRVGNGLFVDTGFRLEPAFAQAMRRDFRAPIETVDFVKGPEKSRKLINARVASQTAQHIRDILPEGSVDSTTRLVLTNAVYFFGSWATPFEKRATKDGDFYANGRTAQRVPMMVQYDKFGYAEADGAQVLEMPYAGNAVSMLVVLPDERDGLRAVEEELTTERLEGWLQKLRKVKAHIRLPRFSLHTSTELRQSLEKLGMVLAFDARAEFGSMSASGGLRLDEAYHQVVVRMDEKGTTAAAATAAAAKKSASRKEVRFNADHPFLFVIRHPASGTLLFLGRVMAPGQ